MNPPHNRAQRVTYMIRAAGSEGRLRVRQTGESGWLRIATRDFAAGGDQKVEVYDNGDEEGRDLHMTVDALRVIRLDDPPPADAGPPPPPQDSGVQPPSDTGAPAQPDVGADAGSTPPPADVGSSLDGASEPLDPNWGTPDNVGCGCSGGIDLSWLSLMGLYGLRRRRR